MEAQQKGVMRRLEGKDNRLGSRLVLLAGKLQGVEEPYQSLCSMRQSDVVALAFRTFFAR